MPKPGKAVKFPELFIHLCYNAYWESALTVPELLKHLPANMPFLHLTLTADLTYSANKHRSFSKGTFTPNTVICLVDIWLRLEYAGFWNRSTMGIFCAANTGLGTGAEMTALKIDDSPLYTKQDRF